MKPILLLGLGLLCLSLTGCGVGAKSGRGFRLPEGDEARGKQAFVQLQCTTCHAVAGETTLPTPGPTIKAPIVIGGEVARVKTYGELVTAIVHPSHRLSPQLHKEWMAGAKLSPMGSFNHTMTVEQMIDLVTYLQPKYKELELNNVY